MTLAMSKCGSCDQPLPESARFCGSCGIKQEADLDLAPVVQTGAAIDDATPREGCRHRILTMSSRDFGGIA